MKKTILSVAVATTLGLTMGAAHASQATPCDLFGDQFQGECRIEKGNVIIEGSNGFGSIVFGAEGENELTLVNKTTGEIAKLKLMDNGYVIEAEDVNGTIYQSKVMANEDGSLSVNKTVDASGNEVSYLKAVGSDGGEYVLAKSVSSDGVVTFQGANGSVEMTTDGDGGTSYVVRDSAGDIIEEPSIERPPVGINPPLEDGLPVEKPTFGGQTTVEQKAAGVEFILEKADMTDEYDVRVIGGELVVTDEEGEKVDVEHLLLKAWNNNKDDNQIARKERGQERRQERRVDRDMKSNPDNIREAATVIVKHKVDNMDGESKARLVNNMLERGDSNYQITDAGLTIDGESYVELTDKQGNVLRVSADEFKAAALTKQTERKTERDLDNAPKLGGERWSDAVTNLTEAGENLMALGQESKAKLQAGAQGIKAGAEDLMEASQTLKTDLTAGKSELEVAAQSATEQMAAQFAAMQKQLDEQAKLIAELQNGENPQVPSTGISPEAESALRDASATLQAKMDVAVNKLQGAAKTLQEKGSKLAPQDPDFGINPPSQGVPAHELGSIGEGQAVAYVQNGLEELYNTGNEQAQQYADKALSDAKSYTDTQIAGINSRIDGIEEDLETVMATSQAVTAARPYLSSNQTNAIGVGLGNSGSQNAIAVGYAHRINENWTANANLSGTSGNEVDYSVGAGLSYAW
ncbi:hypothetical protein GCM10007906_18630 [Vibrio hyugaensis]|uniref:Trimeric autotransporter adhesin YadA-like C-terminal membrane anchor domain-containing protein n=1 Tax=Vibrio hyugaensis TaxID=1534743 RepID=A0ABQ5XZY1_9VIBR|nr:YadA C-terminal domain-containing protein [Vibrio hyugaensis]GLR04276.1 hypothetical protein GCM10007906_18630 [Vibrio hyugaensis]